MKSLYIILLVLVSNTKTFSQGTDVIFWIDNSRSISTYEYSMIKTSVSTLIEKTLMCNPENKISIIQYSASSTPDGIRTPKIWIENDFGNTVPIFDRRTDIMGNVDFAHESLGLIGNALDHIPNPNIYGVPTLNRTHGNTLVIYLFTDAFREGLVSRTSTGIGTSEAFQNYTNFKIYRNATFFVTLAPTGINDPTFRLEAKKAAATIASASCDANYYGEIENYPDDPSATGVPRFFLNKENFILTPDEINIQNDQICSVENALCNEHIILTSPTSDTHYPQQDNRQASISITASNIINNESVAFYHAGTSIIMLPGFHAQYGSRYRAYIEDCSEEFICNEKKNNEKNKKSVESNKSFSLFPNPTSTSVKFFSEERIIRISITSIEGQEIFRQEIQKNNIVELDISNYKKGIYLVTAYTENGKNLISKLIKN